MKLVDRAAIKAHDRSLTPGRYVGVVPEVTCEIAGKGFQHARDGRPSKTKGPAYPLGTAISRNGHALRYSCVSDHFKNLVSAGPAYLSIKSRPALTGPYSCNVALPEGLSSGRTRPERSIAGNP